MGRSKSADVITVICCLDDFWSTLDEEVQLIDRLIGGEISAIFVRAADAGEH